MFRLGPFPHIDDLVNGLLLGNLLLSSRPPGLPYCVGGRGKHLLPRAKNARSVVVATTPADAEDWAIADSIFRAAEPAAF
jgi:hypothetical protein